MTGDALTAFINQDEAVRPDGVRDTGLFTYLRTLSGNDQGVDRRDVIASVFRGTVNRVRSGASFAMCWTKSTRFTLRRPTRPIRSAICTSRCLKEMRDAAGE